MSRKQDFPGWLRQARAANDLTQESLAEAVGCATQTVRSFENGRRRPSREMAARLADVLRFPPAERDDFIRLARAAISVPAAVAAPGTSAGHPNIPAAYQRPALAPIQLPPDPLIGRQNDLEHVGRALLDRHQRLITLLGPGGIGKTRLALQSAADLAARFDDRAAFVALAPVTDAGSVATTIAAALGYVLPSVQSPEAELLAYLREQAMLLVLDNLEHLLAPQHGDQIVMLLANILQHAPAVRLLITSRERLRLSGEVVIELDGLALPSDDRSIAIDRSDAVLLFLERARQVQPDFRLTPETRSAVARICTLLGGVPLGIELAATWVRVLSCAEIATEIERNMDFLALANRNMLPRHRSLRAVMDYSWQLLTTDEQRLLAHLSVLNGGGDRAAITAILPDADGAQLPTLPLLAALVDKSLLRRASAADGSMRYDLHELVRQYAAARLAENPAAQQATQAQHAAYYAEWLARQEPILKSAQQKTALHAITVEIDNLRAAWRWGCAQHHTALLRRMTLALHWFCEVRGWHAEGAVMFAQACAAIRPLGEDNSAPATMQADYWLLVSMDGWYALRRDPVYALDRLQAAMDAQRQLDDREAQVNCAYGLGYLKIFLGDYADAQALLEEARDGAIANDNRWSLSVALVVRGILEVLRSDAATARKHLDTALIAARAAGDPRHISLALNYVGLTALDLGQLDQAEQACRECMTIAAGNQDRYQIGLVLQSLGRVALARGDYAESEWLLNESLATARAIDDRWLEAQALGCLGALAAALGNYTRARDQHRSAVAAAAAAPLPIALDELAALAAIELDTQPDPALVALAYVRQHPMARPSTRASAQERQLAAQPAYSAEQLRAIEQRARAYSAEHPTALLALFGPSRQ
jgi:predicted ATPase/transcriptional regulator with XRE-family HTH domain